MIDKEQRCTCRDADRAEQLGDADAGKCQAAEHDAGQAGDARSANRATLAGGTGEHTKQLDAGTMRTK